MNALQVFIVVMSSGFVGVMIAAFVRMSRDDRYYDRLVAERIARVRNAR